VRRADNDLLRTHMPTVLSEQRVTSKLRATHARGPRVRRRGARPAAPSRVSPGAWTGPPAYAPGASQLPTSKTGRQVAAPTVRVECVSGTQEAILGKRGGLLSSQVAGACYDAIHHALSEYLVERWVLSARGRHRSVPAS
jgi:hypothetical protein